MKLDALADGGRIFVDANILIYHFTGVSPECRRLLQRCECKAVEAFTGTHILLEVLHRLMIIEAFNKKLISGGQPAKKLKKRPNIIKNLSDYNRSVQQIPRLGVRVRAVTLGMIRQSEAIRLQGGLMTNDSVTVAMMNGLGLRNLATYDSDLLRIPELEIYRPGDIRIRS